MKLEMETQHNSLSLTGEDANPQKQHTPKPNKEMDTKQIPLAITKMKNVPRMHAKRSPASLFLVPYL